MFLDSLKDTYQAEIAGGMGYNMYTHQGGVTLTLSGFSEKRTIAQYDPWRRFQARDFSPTRFETIKHQLLQTGIMRRKTRPIRSCLMQWQASCSQTILPTLY